MQLEPTTKLLNLLTAIPSARIVVDRFHVPIPGNEEKSLDELCGEFGITFHNFVQALNDLDWDQEYRSE